MKHINTQTHYITKSNKENMPNLVDCKSKTFVNINTTNKLSSPQPNMKNSAILFGGDFKDKINRMKSLKQIINSSSFVESKSNTNKTIKSKKYLEEKNNIMHKEPIDELKVSQRKINFMKLSGKKIKKIMKCKTYFYNNCL